MATRMQPEPAVWFQTYQTAIVGAVGFLGVILTLVANAAIARRQGREAREHETSVVVRALRAELRSCREAAREALDGFSDGSSNELLVPPTETRVFDANISRLGLLPTDALDTVLVAFLALKEFDRALVLFSTPNTVGPYRVVRPGHRKALAQMHAGLIRDMDAAIEALGSS